MTNQTSDNNKRIAKNTIMLYLRMFLTMVVGLYTSRVVLQTLGVEDYGIYGVVGGIVAMMGFLNASMSGATSRFLTFELGKGDKERLGKTFSSALIVHIIIATVVFVVAETVGLWFLCNKLVIPEGRMVAAHWVYQLSILSSMLAITQVPYNSSIIAHEKMDVYAYVEILNVTLKLLIVYLLVIGNFDKLILYAILMFTVSIIIIIVYRIYCLRRFEECKFRWIWDKKYMKPLLSFSSWNLYYEGTFAARQQGANFILNIFCGVVYNAASAIATTVQGIILGFSSNVIMAFRPQVIKSYAQKDYNKMNYLIQIGTKLGSVLLWAITIPILFNTDYLLQLWLGNVPQGSIVMVQCLLIVNVVNTASSLLVTGIQASGNIRFYSGLCGTIYLLSLGIMYICMSFGLDYTAIYVIILITSFIVNVCYAIILKKQVIQFEFFKYYYLSMMPLLFLIIIDTVVLYCLYSIVPISFLSFITFSFIAFSITILISFFIVMKSNERIIVWGYIKKVLHFK